jgi:hypothetical protein
MKVVWRVGAAVHGLRRVSAVAYIDLIVLLAGVLLLATAGGMPGALGGVALVYLAGLLLVVVLFRRIGQSEHRWSRASASNDEFGLARRRVERSHRQGRAA